ncbi:MAG: NADH-quinone oxidoreductase subunit K [Armatimonadetes bacterium CG2_30_59_28]|nr:NADH-quinone oxidoreductase subunit NuoK [Armatimonadota bacterium]OIO89755.1 MAG: NADH-quinone oxidoreductase subunit K [Armatimonadetes bacterium CG2_30_59_28]PIU66922.1 MAG: NADH-quinone oxidoreductase subunit NuoK [Armatimonadetes bacterium CG07_land_8_20_14_0_80_59_28]PIX37946.1 MAG: NADH-quinone oxidoreductase subunit NuoK [Armatimonadetes bacterium CG_4_8_14_3_um_filter_58_9]PIY49133.1 MAG: NADH-quinone oxidoreductase subunit NuoK [Armatimonadetes bacterium CG_4_10_14_3_um_filter_59_1
MAVHHYIFLSAALFAVGIYGVIARRNAVGVLMSIELMLNAVNINLLAFARYVTPTTLTGQVFAVFVITVAAAEVAVGLALVINVYRNMDHINVDDINLMKW